MTTALPITFDKVSFRAGNVAILAEVSTTIESLSPTLILGPNGSGKSTFLRLCMQLISPTSGQISWGGQDRPPPGTLAMLFQRPVMLRRSVAGNVLYGLARSGLSRRDRLIEAEAVLKRVGLSHLADRPARRLSGGERQRVALARALARKPDILLLDEPTASLDPSATGAVEEIIADAVQSGIKIIMASHDLGQARRLAGDVLFFICGRLCERSPAQNFFDSPATQEAATFIRGGLVTHLT